MVNPSDDTHPRLVDAYDIDGLMWEWHEDELLPEAIEYISKRDTISVLQLKSDMNVGYARASQIVHLLARANLIGVPNLDQDGRRVYPVQIRIGM